MTTKLNETITDAEWEIMRVVWTKKETTSNEIIDILTVKTNWKPSTVKTLLSRLTEKGFLNTRKEGKQFIYSAKVKEDDGLYGVVNDLQKKVCSKKMGSLLIQMIDENELSISDIEALEKVLATKKTTAKDVVKCNCIPGQCQC